MSDQIEPKDTPDDIPPTPAMTNAEFEAIVDEVLAELPEELREVLEECSIIITDWADPELLGLMGGITVEETPYGFYDGTPVGMRGPTQNSFLLPDRIYLFRGPLMEDFPERDQLAEEIRVTLIHELGHMIGFDEDDLEERGLE